MPDSEHPPGLQRLRSFLIIFFTIVFLATLWPIYPLASRIRPMLLGMPFSLAFLVGLIVLTFAVLLWFFYRMDKEDD